MEPVGAATAGVTVATTNTKLTARIRSSLIASPRATLARNPAPTHIFLARRGLTLAATTGKDGSAGFLRGRDGGHVFPSENAPATPDRRWDENPSNPGPRNLVPSLPPVAGGQGAA